MELKGDKVLTAQMVLLGEKANEVVHKAASNWAGHVQGQAQRYAPVLTGRLRDDIHTEVDGGNAEVISDAVNLDTGRSYAQYVELGTGHGPAQPYLYPAFAEHRDVLPEVRTALREVAGI